MDSRRVRKVAARTATSSLNLGFSLQAAARKSLMGLA